MPSGIEREFPHPEEVRLSSYYFHVLRWQLLNPQTRRMEMKMETRHYHSLELVPSPATTILDGERLVAFREFVGLERGE